jgi:hypothetical protein
LGWQSADYEQYADAAAVPSLTNQKDGSVWGSQATSTNQPTFRVNGINGRRAVQYATDDYLSMPAGALGWTQNVPGFTYVALLQITALHEAISTCGISIFAGAPPALTRFSLVTNVADKWQMVARTNPTDGFATAISAASADTSAHVAHAMVDYANAKMRLWVDGQLAASLDGTLVAGNTNNSPATAANEGTDGAATPSQFGNVLHRIQGCWVGAFDNVAFAPMIRSWCQDGGITYAG